MLLLQPAGTILWAGMIFDERLATNQWIGVGLVLIGILTVAVLGTVRRAGVDTPTDP
jgi:drug/metabolite transporter (DMT)-like permease